jgi:2-keto-4-pentenoate hydratase
MTPVSHTLRKNRTTLQEGFLAAQPNTTNTTRIAQAFVDARRDGGVVPEFPGDVPVTLDEGYAVQDAALLLADGVVAGWKVGRINPPLDGIDRLTGPIFADQIVMASADPVAMPVFAQGFAAAEAEFLLRIGTAPHTAKSTYTIDEARAMVDAVHVGIEIASSPFPGINALGPTVTVSDFGNNNGLVVGADAEGWREGDVNDWPVELWINDALIGAATTATMLDGPFGAVRYLLEHLAARGIAMSPGQWVSTGAVTGVHPVAIGDRVEARFDGRFAVHCTIKAR